MNQNTISRRADGATHRAFTLIELLMVISILAILGALTLSMIGGARYDANAARTEAQIRRIKQFIQSRLEDYSVRKLPFRPASPNRLWARNRILIEYIRAEMPCRLNQLAVYPSLHFTDDFAPAPAFATHFANADIGTMTSNVPALRTRMIRELGGASTANEQAECLFEILNSHNDYGSSGMDFIFRAEIGNTDADDNLEILDSWGDPLRFTLHIGDDALIRDPDDGPPTPYDPSFDPLGDPSFNPPSPPIPPAPPALPHDYDLLMATDGPLAVHIDIYSKNMPR